MAVNIIE